MKRTDWFTGDVKPVHVGIYEKDVGDTCPAYAHWNGKVWAVYSYCKETAFTVRHSTSHYQNDPWRGLTVKPE